MHLAILFLPTVISTVLSAPQVYPSVEYDDVVVPRGPPDVPVSVNGTAKDGYFYVWATERENVTATYTNQPGGYSIRWSTQDWHLVGGKGWSVGSNDRVIKYNGTYETNGHSYISAYGWTRDPLVEYYIVESFGTLTPAAGAIPKGTATCNGADYTVSAVTRYNQPSIDGTQVFSQYWSVRRRLAHGAVNGIIDLGCHFKAWQTLGMQLGANHAYQIFSLEAYGSTGSINISISG